MTQSNASYLADSADTALVLIDFMPKLLLGCRTAEPNIIRENAIGLAKIGAAFAMPVITTGGRPDDPLMGDVVEAAGKGRIQVDRQTVDCFATPAFVDAVEATGRKTLVMAGITTDLCVMLPALSALEQGYRVQVVVDASGCFTPQIETAALLRLSAAGVALTSWSALAAELHRGSNWGEGVGPRIFNTFTEHVGEVGLIAAMAAGGESRQA